MANTRLITASLVGAIDWLKNCPDSWREKAQRDLRAQLARDYSAPAGPALVLGTKFESAVYAQAEREPTAVGGSEHFKWFVEECRGGAFQRKTKSYLGIDGATYCIYGKIDALFKDIIKDIKTTSNYKGESKYLNSAQHKLYCFNERITKFRYVVGEFNASERLIAHYAIDYEVQSWDDLQVEVEAIIRRTVDFISRDDELMELYLTKFSQY